MHHNTILVIEDDQDVQNVVRGALEEAGFTAITAYNGAEGLERARGDSPDLVLLDLGLPDVPGEQVVRDIRRTSQAPIIVVTATDGVDSKVDLLQIGANDYLTKPFLPEELLARVLVQFRKLRGQDTVLHIGPLEIRPASRVATCGGQALRLSPREFDLLLLLASAPNRVFSRREIQRAVCGAETRTPSNVVDVHVSNLRGKLRQLGGYGLLRSVRGYGYVLRSTPEDKGVTNHD